MEAKWKLSGSKKSKEEAKRIKQEVKRVKREAKRTKQEAKIKKRVDFFYKKCKNYSQT